jgi:predicted TPR repeat methyltransferase
MLPSPDTLTLGCVVFPGKQGFSFESLITKLRIEFEARMAAFRGRFENLPQTNFALGTQFAHRGKLNDAAFRFRVALKLQPHFPQAQYELGVVRMRQGKALEAEALLKEALKQQPSYPEATYMLATLRPASLPEHARPTRMPEGMAEGFFTYMATHYNAAEARNGYQGAKVIVEQMRPLLPSTSGLVMVDLGCGTGLASELWRRVCRTIIGVDFCQAMLDEAAGAKAGDIALFDNRVLGDIRNLPANAALQQNTADVVLLVNVVQFMGDLQTAMKSASSLLKPGGLLAITFEKNSTGGNFAVQQSTARFGHSSSYITQLGASCGLRVRSENIVALYPTMKTTAIIFQKDAA